MLSVGQFFNRHLVKAVLFEALCYFKQSELTMAENLFSEVLLCFLENNA